MSIDLKDWLNTINMSKENLIDEDPDLAGKYPAFHYQQMSLWSNRLSVKDNWYVCQ